MLTQAEAMALQQNEAPPVRVAYESLMKQIDAAANGEQTSPNAIATVAQTLAQAALALSLHATKRAAD